MCWNIHFTFHLTPEFLILLWLIAATPPILFQKKKKKKKVAAAMEVLLSQSEVRQVARRVIHSPELGEGQLEN